MLVHEVSMSMPEQDGVALRDGYVIVVLVSDRLDAAERRMVCARLADAVTTPTPVAGAVAERGYVHGIPRPREATP